MDKNEMHELPKEWVWASLEESFDIVLGQSPPSSTYNLNGSGLPFYQGKSEFGNFYPTPKKWCTAPKKISEKGDVLISVRAPVGPTNICSEKSCIGRGLAAIRPLSGIETFFALYLMRAFENIIAGKGTGTTFSAITGDKLKKFYVPIPPLAEQRAIISKIEQLFNDLDNGIENFKKAQEQLKIYRQAVLKNACEGKLVPTEAELARAEGRDYEPADVLLARILEERRDKWNGKGKYNEPAVVDTNGLAELPEGWCYTHIEMLLSTERTGIKTGPFGSLLKKHEHIIEGIPVLGIENIKAMKFIAGSKIHITKEKSTQLSGYDALPDDVLISRSGTVGEVCIVPEGLGESRISTNLMRVSLAPNGMLPIFFTFLFNGSPYILDQVTDLCKGSTRNFLNRGILLSLIFNLPPLAEQHRIVTEVERRLSICDKMEETVAESLQKAESLRQSILKKAFEGKLLNEKELEEVRNAPDWEPAEKLLERIKAEKTNKITKSKGKK